MWCSRGYTYTRIKIHSADLSRSHEVELLVDTGSTYTWIDGEVLEKLEVKVRKVWRFKAIDALVECMEEQAPP